MAGKGGKGGMGAVASDFFANFPALGNIAKGWCGQDGSCNHDHQWLGCVMKKRPGEVETQVVDAPVEVEVQEEFRKPTKGKIEKSDHWTARSSCMMP